MADDPFDLQRFVLAQTSTYATALAELRAGEKRSHWMWFIFPQLKTLGRSQIAKHFGLASLDEARAYLGHPIVGARLREATEAVYTAPAQSLHSLFGTPDDLKFKSSMTLFTLADDADDNIFSRALDRWCGGVQDLATLSLVQAGEFARTASSK